MPIRTIESINKDIERAKAELGKLEQERDKFAQLTIQQQLAEALHSKFCHWNHTDGCGWYYNDWSDKVLDRTRVIYLDKAIAMLEWANDVQILPHNLYKLLAVL